MPSTSQPGVRPDVLAARTAWVSSCVTTRARLSRSSDENGGQTTSRRCDSTRATRRAGPVSRTALSDIAARSPTPAMSRVSAIACDDGEVAALEPAARQDAADAGVALLQRVREPGGL